jgi:hypothetical protein
MKPLDLAGPFKEREERLVRAYRRGQATPAEVQLWACLTALAVYKAELGTVSSSTVLRRLRPPGSRAA